MGENETGGEKIRDNDGLENDFGKIWHFKKI